MPCKDYIESPNDAIKYRIKYMEGINSYQNLLYEEASKKRIEYAREIFKYPEEFRSNLINTLGKPLNGMFPKARLIEKKLIAEIEGCNVFRTVIEAVPSVPFYGLLFLQKNEGKYPLIICQHGGGGTPELCSSMYESGSGNYNEMTRRVLKHKVNVYAPQLLLWNEPDEKGNNRISQMRRSIDAALKSVGYSITALELYSIGCALSLLQDEEKVDGTHIGMIGLSYGGLYTMLMSAIDTRIKAAVSCGFFGGIASKPMPDWNWQGTAFSFFDAEIVALVWPRDITLLIGKDDQIFDSRMSILQFEELCSLAKDLQLGNHIRFEVFNGSHELCENDSSIEHLMNVLCTE